MSLAEKIYEDVKVLPEQAQAEIVDYIEYIKHKERKKREMLMDDFINDNMEALKELAK